MLKMLLARLRGSKICSMVLLPLRNPVYSSAMMNSSCCRNFFRVILSIILLALQIKHIFRIDLFSHLQIKPEQIRTHNTVGTSGLPRSDDYCVISIRTYGARPLRVRHRQTRYVWFQVPTLILLIFQPCLTGVRTNFGWAMEFLVQVQSQFSKTDWRWLVLPEDRTFFP